MNGFSLYTDFQHFHYDLGILCSVGSFIILYKNSWSRWRPCHVFSLVVLVVVFMTFV